MVRTDARAGQAQPRAREISAADFAPADWGLLAATALMWGSSFVWIEEGLESFPPALITLLRIALGAVTLAGFRQARARVDRKDLPRIALLGLVWMAAPFLLFPIAQQWIDSSLAGMINGAVPIFTAGIAAVIARAMPRPLQIVGLILGFIGVVGVGWPALDNAESTALGVLLVLLATLLYGIAINLAVPLQHRYGSLPVLFRAQVFAVAMTTIPGLLSVPDATFEATSLLAMVPLGALGTGVAFATMTTLVGRVGASRGSITVYFVPLVAVALGPLVRDETLEAISLVGMVVLLVGAYLASRGHEIADAD
jgi:drug/metabolite transporter (DMT)-like permease